MTTTTIPTGLLKIISDARILLNNAMQNNIETFDYIRAPEFDKGYTEEQNVKLSNHNIQEFAEALNGFEKYKDKVSYISGNIPKEDRALIFTELVKTGLIEVTSVGNTKPLEIFAYIPECRCCKERADIVFSYNPSQIFTHSERDYTCKSCGHSEEKTKCNCKCCDSLWNEFKNTLCLIVPYLEDGFVLINCSYFASTQYEIKTINDINDFISLIERDEIHPCTSFSIKNSDGVVLHKFDEIV